MKFSLQWTHLTKRALPSRLQAQPKPKAKKHLVLLGVMVSLL
jgi:hypothetical protein